MSLHCATCNADDTNYASPLLTVRKCGHAICYTCAVQAFGVDAMSSMASSLGMVTVKSSKSASKSGIKNNTYARCNHPDCGISFNAGNLTTARPDDDEYHRECEVRKRLARIYNKTKDDFGADVDGYNDYLETVERHVASLVSGSDAEKAATEAAIKAYVSTNQSSIAFNAARNDATARKAAEKLESEAATRVAAADQKDGGAGGGWKSFETLKHRLYSVSSRLSHQELTELKNKLESLKNGGRAPVTMPSVPGGPQYVPCPHVFPPAPVKTSVLTKVSSTSAQRRAGGLPITTLLRFDMEDTEAGLLMGIA